MFNSKPIVKCGGFLQLGGLRADNPSGNCDLSIDFCNFCFALCIPLLQSLYKIFASLIQTRLAYTVEEKIWQTQYGFRAKYSTAEALFITRRIRDLYETHGDKLFMLFLDWEKASDTVDQERIMIAIRRLNIRDKS